MLIEYKEIGINPRRRQSRAQAIANRTKARLDFVCEQLAVMLQNPAYIENYEMKLQLKKGVR